MIEDVTLFQGTDGSIVEVWGCPASQTSRALAILQALSSAVLADRSQNLTEAYRSNDWIRTLINEILKLHRLSPDNLTIDQIQYLVFYYEDDQGTMHPGLLKQLDRFVPKKPGNGNEKASGLDPRLELLAGLVSLGLATDLIQAGKIMDLYSLTEINEIVAARQRQMDPAKHDRLQRQKEADELASKHAAKLFQGIPKFSPETSSPVDPDLLFDLARS